MIKGRHVRHSSARVKITAEADVNEIKCSLKRYAVNGASTGSIFRRVVSWLHNIPNFCTEPIFRTAGWVMTASSTVACHDSRISTSVTVRNFPPRRCSCLVRVAMTTGTPPGPVSVTRPYPAAALLSGHVSLAAGPAPSHVTAGSATCPGPPSGVWREDTAPDSGWQRRPPLGLLLATAGHGSSPPLPRRCTRREGAGRSGSFMLSGVHGG